MRTVSSGPHLIDLPHEILRRHPAHRARDGSFCVDVVGQLVELVRRDQAGFRVGAEVEAVGGTVAGRKGRDVRPDGFHHPGAFQPEARGQVGLQEVFALAHQRVGEMDAGRLLPQQDLTWARRAGIDIFDAKLVEPAEFVGCERFWP